MTTPGWESPPYIKPPTGFKEAKKKSLDFSRAESRTAQCGLSPLSVAQRRSIPACYRQAACGPPQTNKLAWFTSINVAFDLVSRSRLAMRQKAKSSVLRLSIPTEARGPSKCNKLVNGCWSLVFDLVVPNETCFWLIHNDEIM
ncbi:hypothetical protein AVEN_148011-1 [Araneus ventricosus]|uniref:Uncharacterized protein n=1 Tax=Araneus ventricosus TaxID=182803 RepID=A0A4Y2RZX4_ARAVE|nr:hypothetical protein AVEN_148011-1 [Araneus ventricosus]